MVKNIKKLASITLTLAIIMCGFVGSNAATNSKTFTGKYVAGDFHTHTYLTDGNKTQADVVKNAFENFDLDWMANSEHGNLFNKYQIYDKIYVGRNKLKIGENK